MGHLTPEERYRIYLEAEARIRESGAARAARIRQLRPVFLTRVLVLCIAAVSTYAIIAARPQGSPKVHPPRTRGHGSVSLSGQQGDLRTNPKNGAELVWIPAGEFVRGSTDQEIASTVAAKGNPDFVQTSWCDSEKPQRRIYLDGYWIYKYG